MYGVSEVLRYTGTRGLKKRLEALKDTVDWRSEIVGGDDQEEGSRKQTQVRRLVGGSLAAADWLLWQRLGDELYARPVVRRLGVQGH